MEPTKCSLLIAAAMLALASCANSDPNTLVGQLQERVRGPKPESEWNPFGVWCRISDAPPTYLPTGYSASRPRSDRDGTWIVDRRDGKRFFVPNVPVNGVSPAVFLAVARELTDWEVHPHDWIHGNPIGF